MRSTITQLRDTVPLRSLSTAEVLRAAEAQANRLRRISGRTAKPCYANRDKLSRRVALVRRRIGADDQQDTARVADPGG
jgi:hypothetical protein